MDSIIKSSYSNSHRYVIDEDSIPKVTSDGEPHEVMTMVAAFSGIIAAIIVLVILIMLIGCRDPNRRRHGHEQQQLQSSANIANSKGVIIPIFNKGKVDGSPQLMSISTISANVDCEGYDNPACDTPPTEMKEIVLTSIGLPHIDTVKC